MENARISKKKIAYEYIRVNIFDGTFGPGYRLVIDQIKKKLHLSSIPVREAIQQLEAENLVQIIPYSGAVVKLVDKSEYTEIQTMLAILDGAATAMASKNLKDEDIEQLEVINNLMVTAINELSLEEFGKLNMKFHKTIYGYCGNSHLKTILDQLWENLLRVRNSIYTFVPCRGTESIAEHKQIIKMLKKHEDPRKIELFCRKHKLEMLKAVQNVIENKGI
ncbi:GntR family transcriptional regulator [Megasphaera paucivorans]|uniref:DNA-binding transcriptional regulator, GntR family n=1 Tax=Megasphaera paucivorans TaxID=349095 RepID=A0A1H0BED1_9FIRM|nr:GntR family transcriptional regulator [Megasphaera paucivorans]SDN43988.1 DNA-binding transcriptional regulator, GntR family [Megasphaera paucivorans]